MSLDPDDAWEQVVRGLRGTTAGLEHERDALLAILTDLIAELREGSEECSTSERRRDVGRD